MKLSKEAIKEFKEIYKEEFGIELSDKRAEEIGEGLLELFSIVYGPYIDPEEENKDTSEN